MTGRGFVIPFASSLTVTFENEPWHVLIRRIDDQTHGPFCDYHDTDLTPADLRRYLPNAARLEWKPVHVDQGPFKEFGWFAEDTEFKVNLVTHDPAVDVHSMRQRFLALLEEAP